MENRRSNVSHKNQKSGQVTKKRKSKVIIWAFTSVVGLLVFSLTLLKITTPDHGQILNSVFYNPALILGLLFGFMAFFKIGSIIVNEDVEINFQKDLIIPILCIIACMGLILGANWQSMGSILSLSVLGCCITISEKLRKNTHNTITESEDACASTDS